MCAWGDSVKVRAADREFDVDRCIAPIVQALNDAGVQTAMSCCGHGEGDGFVLLADGRTLAVLPVGEFKARGFQAMAERFDRRRT